MQTQDDRIFVSYAREDCAFVQSVVAHLRSVGVPLWMDESDIRPGERWDQAIEQALKACSDVLVVLSPEAVKSNNVLDEIAFAVDEGKRIIPIKHKECNIPLRLRRIQYIDFTADQNSALRRLVEFCVPKIAALAPDHSPRVDRPRKVPRGRVFMYHVRLEGSPDQNQLFLTKLLSFPFVERQTRFIIENEPRISRVAVFSERDFEPVEMEEIANRSGTQIVEFIER
jgi:TIR domain